MHVRRDVLFFVKFSEILSGCEAVTLNVIVGRGPKLERAYVTFRVNSSIFFSSCVIVLASFARESLIVNEFHFQLHKVANFLFSGVLVSLHPQFPNENSWSCNNASV